MAGIPIAKLGATVELFSGAPVGGGPLYLPATVAESQQAASDTSPAYQLAFYPTVPIEDLRIQLADRSWSGSPLAIAGIFIERRSFFVPFPNPPHPGDYRVKLEAHIVGSVHRITYEAWFEIPEV